MSTGDLHNNLKKLQFQLKKINYNQDNVDFDGLSKGVPTVYLQIYHYVFVDYSRKLAESISTLGVELYGKTDMRFMESMYKILRELFSYKPPITREQFFNSGFTEKKIIMCTEILSACRNKFGPKQTKAKHVNPIQAASKILGPRSSDAQELNQKVKNVTTNERRDRIHAEKAIGPTTVSDDDIQPRPILHQKPAEGRLVPRKEIHIKEQVAKDIHPRVLGKNLDAEIIECCPGDVAEDYERPIDIIATTPSSKPIPSHFETSTGYMQNPAITTTINRIDTIVRDLNSKVIGLENRLGMVEGLLAMQQEDQERRATQTVSPERLENLLARMSLIENKVIMLEASNKKDLVPHQHEPQVAHSTTTAKNSSQSQSTITNSTIPYQSKLYQGGDASVPLVNPSMEASSGDTGHLKDIPAAPSPIVRTFKPIQEPLEIQNNSIERDSLPDEDTASKCSTPSNPEQEKCKDLALHFASSPVRHRAERITKMMRETALTLGTTTLDEKD